ncbi:MAG: 16S rRNA (guanine(966)-N(2))-methyltransferase RsmD [Desulfocapsa sp.]|nr:16S rRNA (guanine(966)-N(2))-methyltransferase RsmD [Desulfocapsa sp.]MBN4064005.1 16S rRNA (guanine(966)-N(2))-methyltransferase RsmD [bacterium AH-315-I07]
MRIIGGLARGRKLKTPGRSNSIRPTTDRAREALFSIIGSMIHSARVLDLFAGTGALGLEAFSRGAKQVVFVEKESKAIHVINHNCALCTKGIKDIQGDELIVIQHDLCRGVNFKHPMFADSPCFDIIFLDPPYNKNLAEKSLSFLDTSNFITASTLIIAEESSANTLPDSYLRLKLADQRRYGDTGFWFYKARER